MSDIILTDWTIFYDEAAGGTTGFKQIKWTGTTGTTDINDWYSEVMHFFNIPSLQTTFVDDFNNTTPLNAVTPTEYEIGAFDTGDAEPWFIDPESIKHLTGGSLKSVGWTRVTGTDIGIIRIPWTAGTDFVDSDIGRAVTLTGGNTGRLLHFELFAGDTGEAWIRPDTNAAGDDFDDAGTLAATGGTGSVTVGAVAQTTGEMTWTNIFTIGTFQANTRLYVAQNNVEITNSESSGSGVWWSDGQIDILILTTDQDVLTDNGFLTTYGRQFNNLYDHFITDASAGGRIPVPIATGPDSNDANGNRQMVLTDVTVTTFLVGDVITDDGGAPPRGIVTSVTGSIPTQTIQYYLVDDVTTDFSGATGAFTGTSNATATAVAPTNVNAASYTDVTITFGTVDETFLTSQGFASEVMTTVTTHPFVTEDAVVYTKDGGSEAVGLTEANTYFVNNISTTTISLHLTAADALADTNRVDLTTSGAETHRLIRKFDIDVSDVAENYSIIIDCANRVLTQVYERLKFVLRRGETATLDGLEGQQYIGTDNRVDYTSPSATALQEGETVTQTTSGATGLIVLNETVDQYLMLRDSQGTFDGTNLLTDESANTATASVAEIISPVKVSPFGTFAGGRFFGARGVVLENVPTADLNNFELIDDDGNRVVAPIQVSFEATGIQTDSEVRLYETGAGAEGILNPEIAGIEQILGSSKFVVIVDGGTGYTALDTLTIVGGTGTATTLTVDSVDSGVITAVSIDTAGSYSVNPPAEAGVTGGTGGDDATFRLTIDGTFTELYTFAGNRTAFLIVFHLSFKEVRVLNLTLSTTNQSIPIQQNIDRTYTNP